MGREQRWQCAQRERNARWAGKIDAIAAGWTDGRMLLFFFLVFFAGVAYVVCSWLCPSNSKSSNGANASV